MFSSRKILLASAAFFIMGAPIAFAGDAPRNSLAVPPSAHEMPERSSAQGMELAAKQAAAVEPAASGEIDPAPVAVSTSAPAPVSAPAAPAVMADWSYSGATAPQHWGQLDKAFGTCASGKAQSPVNIAAYQPVQMERLQIAYAPTAMHVVNSGKGIGVKYEPGSKFLAEGITYDLQAFKFQSPSEHYVNGAPYPLEIQFLHTDAQGKIAGLAIFAKLGAANPVIQSIWENIPATMGSESVVENVTLDVAALMPNEGAYYTYDGSLSIPPCAENVKWYVMKTPIEISLEQLHALQALYPSNARPVQPLNGRVVKGTQ